MKVFGIIHEDENGDFAPAKSGGSSTKAELRFFDDLKKAERSRQQLQRKPEHKGKNLIIGVFELQTASAEIDELKFIKRIEEKNGIFQDFRN